MGTVRIEFTKPVGHPFPIISYLIRFFTNFGASHAVMHFMDRGAVFHIYFNDWVMMSTEAKEEKHKIVHAFNLTIPFESHASIYQAAANNNGKKTKGYYYQLFGSLLVMPFRALGIYLKNPFSSIITSYLCSEYILNELKREFKIEKYLSTEMAELADDNNTFNTKDLYAMLSYLVEIQSRGVKLPFKVTKIK